MLELETIMDLLEPLVQMAPATDIVSDRGWEIWHTALQDLPADAVKAAVIVYLTSEATGPWLPAPAVIRRLAVEHQHGRSLSGDEAWGLILEAAGRWSQYDRGTARAAVEALPAAVRDLFHSLCGTFGDFRQKTIAAQQQDRRAFLSAWREQAERITRDHMRPDGLQARIAESGMPAPRAIENPAVRRLADGLKAERKTDQKTIR